MFYSAQNAGFYSTEIHGVRRIKIVDSAWVRPRSDVVIQPGGAAWVGNELVENSGDKPITISDVPDMTALPDTLEVANPGCSIPDDAVEITRERYEELLEGQAGGKQISGDSDGYPVLVDQPLLAKEQLETIERSWRDAQMSPTDALVSRHRDERESGEPTTLTAEQYNDLQTYRRQLRNWPQGTEFPLVDHRPVAPDWLTGPLQ